MRCKRFFVFLLIFSFVVSLGLLARVEKPIEPVNWRKLVPFLIDIPDWKAEGNPEGSTGGMGGFKISEAKRNYTSGDRSLEIEIIDGGFVPMVYAAFKMAMNFEVDSSEELIKKVTIDGFPGVEQYTYESKEAEVTLLLSDRFLLQLSGDNFKDASELKAIAKTLDLKGIANLAK